MVTVTFRTFQEFKDFIISIGKANPNVAAPNRFHTLAGNGTVAKMAHVYAGGGVTFMYNSPTGETIDPSDPWFAENKEMEYRPSVLVANITEAIS
jgi:hypothetical protein